MLKLSLDFSVTVTTTLPSLNWYVYISPFRPDHLSCHVKHVHSSERPFKCQVTVRVVTGSLAFMFILSLHFGHVSSSQANKGQFCLEISCHSETVNFQLYHVLWLVCIL